MAGIQDIGNGFGYVYMTKPDGTTIESIVNNTLYGVRGFKENGNIVAPFASKRSAYGSFTITGVIGAGSITAISVFANDQIAAPFVVTALTPAQAAQAAATAINSYTPGTGYDYVAVSVGSTVYLYAPPSAGSIPNGYAIVVSDSGGVITYTTEAFKNGSDESGVYDTVMGSRFFLNADYGPTGISGETPADPTLLTNSVEITKYFVTRGQNLGIFSPSIQANTNTLSGVDRSGSITKITVTPQVGNTETVVKISPEDFVDGDIVFVQAELSTDIITVESMNAVTVPVTGNIVLTEDTPWISNAFTTLMLQFRFVTGVGPVFLEISRSLGGTPNDVLIGKTLFVSDATGDDASAQPHNLNKKYKSLDAALTAATIGDSIEVFPGTYTCTNVLGLSVVANLSIYLHPGVVLSGNAMFNGFLDGFTLTGYGDITSTGDNVMESPLGSTRTTIIECNSLTTTKVANTFGGRLNIFCRNFWRLYAEGVVNCFTAEADTATPADRYEINITAPKIYLTGPPGTFGIYLSNLPENSTFIINGDIVNENYNLINLVFVSTRFLLEMNWLCVVNGDVIDLTTQPVPLGQSQLVAADENSIWTVAPARKNYGFFINGNILANDKLAIRTTGGRVRVTGNINSSYTFAPGTADAAVQLGVGGLSGNPSLVELYDGIGYTANGSLVYYNDALNLVRFKNYVGVSTNFLVEAFGVGQSYELFSAYSNVAVNAANVANSIAGTTLVVDAAITI